MGGALLAVWVFMDVVEAWPNNMQCDYTCLASKSPGGAFGNMGIATYGPAPTGANCQITSNIPTQGYTSGATYNVMVTSTKALGRKLTSNVAGFAGSSGQVNAASKVTSSSHQWTASSASSASFKALCGAGGSVDEMWVSDTVSFSLAAAATTIVTTSTAATTTVSTSSAALTSTTVSTSSAAVTSTTVSTSGTFSSGMSSTIGSNSGTSMSGSTSTSGSPSGTSSVTASASGMTTGGSSGTSNGAGATSGTSSSGATSASSTGTSSSGSGTSSAASSSGTSGSTGSTSGTSSSSSNTAGGTSSSSSSGGTTGSNSGTTGSTCRTVGIACRGSTVTGTLTLRFMSDASSFASHQQADKSLREALADILAGITADMITITSITVARRLDIDEHVIVAGDDGRSRRLAAGDVTVAYTINVPAGVTAPTKASLEASKTSFASRLNTRMSNNGVTGSGGVALLTTGVVVGDVTDSVKASTADCFQQHAFLPFMVASLRLLL